MCDKLDDVQKTLTTPDKIRISKSDPQAYLFILPRSGCEAMGLCCDQAIGYT
jgi:hypothetical protein